MNAFSARTRPVLRWSSVSTARTDAPSGLRHWLHAILDDAAPRPASSDLVSGVVARGRQTVQEIRVSTFGLPRMWSRSDEDDEDTRVEGLQAQ